ncbi:hypothetical protein HDU97_004237 [Phlyctochytrium planicorne]|nr:hypothetical protein HDU97_004237 [Phlyctochytrium planicorne]
MLKFYDIVPEVASYDGILATPNTWKIRLALLRKRIPFETVVMNVLEISTILTERFRAQNKDPNFKATAPTIELEDGTLLCDSFKIALYLEEAYPDAPSLFDHGTGMEVKERGTLALGKRFARLMDTGMGASDPQWNVWFDVIFPQLYASYQPGPARDYLSSDARLGGPGSFQAHMDRPQKEDLVSRNNKAIGPLVTLLKEQGDFLQGSEPGFADFVIFGRYAMVRNHDVAIAKEVFEGVDPVIGAWVERMLDAFPQVKDHLKPS